MVRPHPPATATQDGAGASVRGPWPRTAGASSRDRFLGLPAATRLVPPTHFATPGKDDRHPLCAGLRARRITSWGPPSRSWVGPKSLGEIPPFVDRLRPRGQLRIGSVSGLIPFANVITRQRQNYDHLVSELA